MDRFEYKILFRTMSENYDRFVTTLNEYGREGWDNYAVLDGQFFLMKRKIKDKKGDL